MLIDNKVIKLYCEGESDYDYEKYDEHIEMEQYIVNLDSHKRVQPLIATYHKLIKFGNVISDKHCWTTCGPEVLPDRTEGDISLSSYPSGQWGPHPLYLSDLQRWSNPACLGPPI